MSRFTTQRYEVPFKPAPTLQGLMALSNELQTGFEELNLLRTLQAHLQRLDQGYVMATSSEQLMVASTINLLLGSKNELAVSIENIQLQQHFDTGVSLEGVGDMIKTSVDWIVKKVKEFFAFLRNLIRKLFSGDEKKAEKYREGSKFDFEESKRKMDEALKNMRESRQEHRQKMAKAFDDLERGRKSSEETQDALNDIYKKMEGDFKVDSEAKKELSALLRLARLNVVGASKSNRDSYTLGGKSRAPFTTSKEFLEFTQIVSRDLPQEMRKLTDTKIRLGDLPKMDDLKSRVKGIQSIRNLDKYFEETDEDGITFLTVKRLEPKAIEVGNGVMVDILTNCSDALVDIKTVLLRLENTEKSLDLRLKSEDNLDGNLEESLKVAKVWLKLINTYTKTLVDTRNMITVIGDDALRVIESLK